MKNVVKRTAKALLSVGAAFLLLTGAALADPPNETAAWTDPSYGAWHSCVIGGGGYLLDTLISPSNPKRMYVHGDMGRSLPQ